MRTPPAPLAAAAGAVLAVILTLGSAAPAAAQPQEVAPEALREKAMTETSTTVPDGWRVTAKLGGSVSVTDAQNVVGATDGTAIQIGLNLGLDARYKHDQHTWENSLKIQEALQRTPPPDDDTPAPFVKSLDNLDFVSTYIYRFTEPDWLGPFVQFKLNTQIFPTTTEPTQNFDLIITEKSGNQRAPQENLPAGTDIDQNEAFEPLLLRETAGLFGEPLAEDVFTAKFKAGVGAQQIIARDGFTLIEVDTSAERPVYRLQQLQSTVDLGVEGTVALNGYILKDILTWNASVVAFLPAVTSGDVVKVDGDGNPVTDDDGNPVFLDTIDRLNLEITAGVALKITKYVSFDWNLLVRRFPQIRDAYQVQNAFLLTLTADLI